MQRLAKLVCLFLIGLLWLPLPVRAQSGTEASPVVVGAVKVETSTALPVSLFAEAVEPFIGRELNREELSTLAASIARVARDQGFPYASATILPQALTNGILHVVVNEGIIDLVRVDGSENRQVSDVLRRLVGRAPNRSDMERAVLLAEDVPGIEIVRSRFVREGGKGVLVVQVREKKASGFLVVDNYGPKTVGPLRGRLRVNLNNVFADGDAIRLDATSTIVQPRELGYGVIRYSRPIGSDGAEAGFSVGHGEFHPGGRLRALDTQGTSTSASLYASYPLLRGRDASLWLNGEVAWLGIDQDRLSTPAVRDRISTASVGLYANVKVGSGRLRGGVSLTQGLGVLDATAAGSPTASRLDGDARFTKGNVWLGWYGDLNKRFTLNVGMLAQLASRPLLAAHELGFGGPGYGRAFDFSERSGEDGIMGSIELAAHYRDLRPWLQRLQVYAFADGGTLSNKRGGFGGGDLFSAGAGLRADIRAFDLALEVAVPLNESRYATGDRSPRFNFLVGANF